MTNFLYSLISLFIALFFILLGFIGIILSWSSNMQSLAISLILEHSVLIFLFGFSFLAIGIATAVNIILNTRRHYYHFKVSGQNVSVDTTLIQNYLQRYFKELFPDVDVPYQLQVKKNKLHITVDLPYVAQSEQEVLLERIRTELRELFSNFLGYRNQFQLSASFQSPPR